MPKRQITGTVTSAKMNKTIVVQVDRTLKHGLYEKLFTKSKMYYAHDESEDARVGDVVLIEESRPISKTKRWNLVEVITKNEE